MMADHMTLRRLGKTNVELTALGLGTAGLGGLFESVTDEAADRVIAQAWNSGCRYFDTSPFYGHGQAELRVGRGLRARERSQFKLSTKVGRLFRRPESPKDFRPEGWIGGLPFEIRFDYSYDGIMRSVEDSYLRLGLPQIDLILIHDLDSWFHPDPELLSKNRKDLLGSGFHALEELKTSNVIKAYGAGLNDRATMQWFLEHTQMDFFVLALRYTLLENDVLDDELPKCRARDIGIIIGGAFNSGILASGAVSGAKYNYQNATLEIMERVRRIEAICERHKTPLAAAALQFPAFHPCVTSVIPGALNPDQVKANIAAFDFDIPQDFWMELKSEKLLRADAPVLQ